MKGLLAKAGTVLVALVMLGGGALVLWNVFGMGPYGDTCGYSIGCKSFLCLQHELHGSAQVSSSGRCTKECEADSECGAGAKCVVLDEASRDDLPPFGKPDKACIVVRESPSDIRR